LTIEGKIKRANYQVYQIKGKFTAQTKKEKFPKKKVNADAEKVT